MGFDKEKYSKFYVKNDEQSEIKDISENIDKKNNENNNDKTKHVYNNYELKKSVKLRKVILINMAAITLMIISFCIATVYKDINQQRLLTKNIDKVVSDNEDKTSKTATSSAVHKGKKVKTTTGISDIRKDLDADKPMIALTFDDGPYTPVTVKIINALVKNDARATFFMVGNRVATYKSAVLKVYRTGNQIAGHTYDHADMSCMKTKKIIWEMNKMNDAIEKITGHIPEILRPSYGDISNRMRKEIDVPMVCWSVDTQDWKYRNSKQIFKNIKNVSDGDIVLMHDLYPTTAKAVEKMIPYLEKKGYQLVTIDELYYYKHIKLKNGCVYKSAK